MNRKVSLDGEWRFTLDPEKIGLREDFPTGVFGGAMTLPGTVSEERLSSESPERLTDALTDPYKYEGWAWLGRHISLDKPLEALREPSVFLHLERTRNSMLFADGVKIGSCDSLCTPHVYNLTEVFRRKKSRGADICIMLDNTSYPVHSGHMTSFNSQTNWLGITGGVYIMVRSRVYLSDIELFPDPKTGEVHIKANINGNGGQHGNNAYTLAISAESGEGMIFRKKRIPLPEGGKLDVTYDVGINFRVWDEINPATYELKITLTDENGLPDVYRKPFGFRDLSVKDGKFFSGGHEVFFRGRCDAMVFPKTGYAPCDVSAWIKRLKIMKHHGLNLIRFASCCPPEAAFFAADILGIYLCPELPLSGAVALGNPAEVASGSSAADFIRREGERILREYGSHPSFAMLSLGEEIKADPLIIEDLIAHFKTIRSDILYSSGANNLRFTGSISRADDFLITSRLSKNAPLRGGFSASDPPYGHIQLRRPDSQTVYTIPETTETANIPTAGSPISPGYSPYPANPANTPTPAEAANAENTEDAANSPKPAEAVNAVPANLPIIAHEVGQYAMFPKLDGVLDDYSGVLKPYLFEAVTARLEEAGLMSFAERFARDSGLFVCQLIKSEIEANLRSTCLSGYHLLDICDYPGGGGAYVGILDVFGKDKGLISEREWQQFCSPLCVVASFEKYTYISEEYLTLTVTAANFTGKTIPGEDVSLVFREHNTEIAVYNEKFRGSIPTGRSEVARFELKMPFSNIAKKLTMSIGIPGASNDYTLWLYPEDSIGFTDRNKTGGIVITSDLDEMLATLEAGGRVLFFPDHIQHDSMIPGEYCADIWNYARVTKSCENSGKVPPVGTLGLSINNTHPALDLFPCETFTTPQWYDIVTSSCALIIDGLDIDPIVSVIDNPDRNKKLAFLFEAQAGNGSLMVCMANIPRLQSSRPSMQLTRSLLTYMNSDEFKPQKPLSVAKLRLMFTY